MFSGFFVAFLDASSQFDFFLGREKFYLTDFAKVKLDGGVTVVGAAVTSARMCIFGFANDDNSFGLGFGFCFLASEIFRRRLLDFFRFVVGFYRLGGWTDDG